MPITDLKLRYDKSTRAVWADDILIYPLGRLKTFPSTRRAFYAFLVAIFSANTDRIHYHANPLHDCLRRLLATDGPDFLLIGLRP